MAVLPAIATAALAARRPVRVSTLLAPGDRTRISPNIGWSLQGMVFAPDTTVGAGRMSLDLPALARDRERVPAGALLALPVEADAAAFQMQAMLRCSRRSAPSDALLVSACSGP
jgi:hypothetical protein